MHALKFKYEVRAEDNQDGNAAKNVEGWNISPGSHPQVLNGPAEEV